MSDIKSIEVSGAVAVEVSKPKKVNLVGNLVFGKGWAVKTAYDMAQVETETEYYARVKDAAPFEFKGKMIVSAIRINEKTYNEIIAGTRTKVFYFDKDRCYIDA